MASYEQPLQDEGYSEDPMTVGTVSGVSTSGSLPAWIEGMSVAQRAGKNEPSPELRLITNIVTRTGSKYH